jgi:uncharacterized protein (DUF2236 family)
MDQVHNVDQSERVSRTNLDALHAEIESQIVDPRAGLFGSGSASWQINRESALFLGAGRAALLQLAHPWVAVALEQHSSLMNDPIARFHGTFRVVFTMIFGTREQALRASEWLYNLHTRVEGALPDAVAGYARGSRYEANSVPALRWVYATLVDSAVKAYEFALPVLTHAEREAYYAESKVLAGLFGMRQSDLPENWKAFGAYMDAMFASDDLGVDERARRMAKGLMAGAGSWVKPPQWYQALTTAWLPERLRTEFRLGYSLREERAVAKAQQRLPRFYQALPSSLRFTGPYQEAQARLTGRGPGIFARAMNRFWIGEAAMPFGDCRTGPKDQAAGAEG